MKHQAFLTLAATALLAAGCSSDELTADGTSNGQDAAKGKAYVALNLSLPTTSGAGTRTDVDYNQGTAAEYNVKSLTVVYFDSNDNLLKSVTYDASQLTWSTPPSTADGITTQATLPVEQVSEGEKKILVLVNNKENKVVDCNDNGEISTTITKWDGIKDKKAEGLTNATKFTGDNKDQFFMSNSPLSDGTLLVKATPQSTVAEAKAKAKTVYVERAVAKVTLEKNNTFSANNDWKTTVPASSSYSTDEVTILDWALDVTNKSEYAVRHYDKTWNDYENTVNTQSAGIRFRDTNHKLTGNTTSDAFRTHFAEDPNFDKNTNVITYTSDGVVDLTNTSNNSTFNYIQANFETNKIGLDKSAYCLENTFDVENMKEGNTTRIIVKAKYTPKSNLADGVNSITEGETWYTIGNSSLVYNGDKLADLVKAAIGETGDVKIDASKFAAGKAAITKECFKVGTNSADLTNEQLKVAQAAIGEVTTYKEGICYYTSLIKHFGDTYTPWDGKTNYTQTDAGNTYTTNYLGRYGVVRNNSYVITLNSVTAPGKPVIPTPTNDPDDMKKYYLQTTVQIMDWAVRTNSIDL